MGGTVLHSWERDLQGKEIRSGCGRMGRSSLSRRGADGLSVSQAEEDARAKAWRREPAWCVWGGLWEAGNRCGWCQKMFQKRLLGTRSWRASDAVRGSLGLVLQTVGIPISVWWQKGGCHG